MEEILREIAAGPSELVTLDGCSLTTAGLERIVSALQVEDCSANVMAISLANNLLTDDACNLLHSALQNPDFCPSLLTLNFQENARLTEQGYAVLEQMVSVRPELQVLVTLLDTYSAASACSSDAFVCSHMRGFTLQHVM